MAKNCSVCSRKMGLLDGKIIISNGIVCAYCWAKAGLDMKRKTMLTAPLKTSNQIKDLIEIETLKNEAVRAGLRREAVTVNNKSVKKNKPIANNEASKKDNVKVDTPKAIDIILTVDKENNVGFFCEGHPVINFDDLINGKEMIIGDGIIRNESANDLPEVRIACEFDPPIIDSGLIYYEAGTFTSGMEERFEIDDPPVNLEEYAKIQRTRNGKLKLTLFLGEQEMHTEECTMIVKPAPEEELKQLMNAVMYEEEKNSSGPVNVFLYARNTGTYEIDLMRKPELLYSMYSNGKEQLIGDVFVSNESGKTLRKIQFEADFTSDILNPIKVLLGDVPPGENISFEVDDPAIDVTKLEMLTEIENCIATYRLLVNGKIVAESTGKITICPYNQWNAALILLPAYITPNHPNVINVLQNASKWMLVNGLNPSLEGYQSDGKRVEEMVGAVYNAVKEANIIYSNPPASFFGPQRIRLCETVLQQKFGTCMDMTILFASCLESFGLHPVLITAPGHIFAGVWLNAKGRLQEPVVSDANLIQKYIKAGELVAVECTAMNIGQDTSYEEAKNIATKTIQALADNHVEDHECIDVQIARAIGVRPLPIRVQRTSEVESQTKEEKKTKSVSVIDSEPETITGVEKKAEPAVSNESKNNTSQVKYVKEEYKSFNEDLSSISIDTFYEKNNKRIIKEAIAKIVEIEGPISQPALIRTLINTTSLGRTGKQINEHIDKLVAAADVKITRQNGVRFLWEKGSLPETYLSYRFKEQRNPEDICKYEMKNAVGYLLQENGPMTKDEIIKGLVSLFGFGRSSKKLEDGVNAAIKAAREFKTIEQNNDKKFELI